MNFTAALNAMASGKSVRRPSMQAGMSVFLVTSLSINGTPATTTPFYAFNSALPGLMTYQPSQVDMAATDWATV